jgi:cation diffusion facilitator family transporter
VALLMGLESVERLLSPQTIHFDRAIAVAVIGLLVNLLSAWLLHGGQLPGHRHHDDVPDHHHSHTHHDHNLRAAYLHVLADALTSLLAIVALFSGKYFGWIWMDAAMGLVGAALITKWGYGLLRDTSRVLLDSVPDENMPARIRGVIEADADNRIADLHVWQLGPLNYAAIISLVTHKPRNPQHYKALLVDIAGLNHVTIEVNPCTETPAPFSVPTRAAGTQQP